jgi:predicted XRE-type DNA-binding protein
MADMELRKLIRQSDMTQGQVSEALGVDQAYVSNWIHGKRLSILRRRYVVRLSEVIDAPVEEILRAIGPPK